MGLFRRKPRPGTVRKADSGDIADLVAFAESRRGVEGYVEPKTAFIETTVALVAHDGEWIRRRCDDPGALAKRLSIPVYDVHVVGYPARMREYTRRKAEEQRRPRSDGE